MKLNELKTEAYEIAKANGWHDKEYSDEHWLMLVITEISEAINADRKGNHADEARIAYFKRMTEGHDDFDFKTYFEQNIKDTFEDECADVVIRLLDLAGLINTDVPTMNTLRITANVANTSDTFLKKSVTETLFSVCCMITNEGTISHAISVAITGMFAISDKYRFNLMWFIEQKMKYNRLRGYHHGGKKY